MADPIQENADAYNQLLKNYKGPLSDYVNKLGEATVTIASKAADEATQGAESDPDVKKSTEETNKEIIQKRKEALAAWGKGFTDQLGQLENIYKNANTGEFDYKAVNEWANELQKNNPELYGRFLKELPGFDNVLKQKSGFSGLEGMERFLKGWRTGVSDLENSLIYKDYLRFMGQLQTASGEAGELSVDEYIKNATEAAKGGTSNLIDYLASIPEEAQSKVLEYLDAHDIDLSEGMDFQSALEETIAGTAENIKAIFNSLVEYDTQNSQTIEYIENLKNAIDSLDPSRIKAVYDAMKEADQKKLREALGLDEHYFDNFSEANMPDFSKRLNAYLVKQLESSTDLSKKVLPGLSTLFDPNKTPVEFQTQVETMRKGIDTLHKALGQYAAIQDETLVKGTEDWNDAVENLATYASVDQNLLKAGVGWDSVLAKLTEDTQLYSNSLKAINEEIEKSKGQKVAKGQEEAWNKVAKAAGMTRDQLEQYGQSLFDPRSRIKFDRNKVSWQAMNAKGWDVEPGSYSTFDSFSTGVQLADGKVVTLTVTPILPNGKVLSEAEVNQYIEDNLQGLNSIDDIFNADNGENGKTIVMNAYEGGTQEIIKQAEAAEMAIHSLSDAYETMAADATFDPQSAFGEYGEGWWEGLERIAADSNDANQALAQ